MKRVISLCALGLGIAGTLAWAVTEPENKPQPATSPTPASPAAPAFPAPIQKVLYAAVDLRGKPAPKLEIEKWLSKEPETKGKVVLIDFWATWCRPCIEVIPELQALQDKFKDDLVVIGVSDQSAETVLPFMGAHKITYSMGIDTKSKMKSVLGVQGIPHVLVIDSAGVVRWQGFPQLPDDELTEKVVQQIIDADKAQRAKPAAPPKTVTDPKPAK